MSLRRGVLSLCCRRTMFANERANNKQSCMMAQKGRQSAGHGVAMRKFAGDEVWKATGRRCASSSHHQNVDSGRSSSAEHGVDSRSSPGVQPRGGNDEAPAQAIDAVQCSRTFCPTDVGDRCPLAHQGLPLPRGDEQRLLQLHQSGGAATVAALERPPLKCPRAYRGLLVDAAGTLIAASQSTEEIYHEIGVKYGIKLSEEQIAAKYKAAYGQPWCRYRMRYEEDGRLFWRLIVEEATGCTDPALLEDLYQYYTTDKAWHIGDKDAEKALKAMRAAGLKIAVVSNFDTRLRPLMRVLRCYDWFDAIIVSAEVGMEKPNPEIFWKACRELGVKPSEVLHVGDDRKNDIVGASAAGCDSLLWGEDVSTFKEVAHKLGVSV